MQNDGLQIFKDHASDILLFLGTYAFLIFPLTYEVAKDVRRRDFQIPLYVLELFSPLYFYTRLKWGGFEIKLPGNCQQDYCLEYSFEHSQGKEPMTRFIPCQNICLFSPGHNPNHFLSTNMLCLSGISFTTWTKSPLGKIFPSWVEGSPVFMQELIQQTIIRRSYYFMHHTVVIEVPEETLL